MVKSKRVKLPYTAIITSPEITIDSNNEFSDVHKMMSVKGFIKNGKVKFVIKCNIEVDNSIETVKRLLEQATDGKVNIEIKS